MKPFTKMFLAALATALIAWFFIANRSDEADDMYESNSVELGGACLHDGCKCKSLRAHKNKTGEAYGICVDCRHMVSEHRYANK